MTHAYCPRCRVRFTAAAAAHLAACPTCGDTPRSSSSAEALLGFELFTPDHTEDPIAQAVAVALPVPDPGTGRS